MPWVLVYPRQYPKLFEKFELQSTVVVVVAAAAVDYPSYE